MNMYGNNFGNGFGNYTPNYAQNNNQNVGQVQDDRIWVQNENAAEAYLVAANSFVRLWDSQKPVFYEKRSDAIGRPFPMEVYEYKKKSVQHTAEQDELMKEIDDIKNRLIRLEGGKNESESNADDAAV